MSKSTSSNTPRRENPRAQHSANRVIAQRANDIGLGVNAKGNSTLPSFGASVTETQVSAYVAAMKSAKLSRASFIGTGKGYSSYAQIVRVARGETKVGTLGDKTKSNLAKLKVALDAEYAKRGGVNKTWPRKHCIVFAAMFETKTPRKAKAKPEPVVESTQEVVAA